MGDYEGGLGGEGEGEGERERVVGKGCSGEGERCRFRSSVAEFVILDFGLVIRRHVGNGVKDSLGVVDNVLHGSIDSFSLYHNMKVLDEHLKRSAFSILMSMKSS